MISYGNKVVDTFRHGSVEKILEWGCARIGSGPISVLAGHFWLVFDSERGKLVPLIESELSQCSKVSMLLPLVHDFPDTTFCLGLSVVERLGSGRSKISLLVDDETIRHIQELPSDVDLQMLRRDFFHGIDLAPKSYLEQVARRGLNPCEIFEPNTKRRASSILPTESYLFSEHVLRARFRKKVRGKLEKLDGFKLREDPIAVSVLFEREGCVWESCTIEKGGEQTCSGPAFAMMEILRDRSYRHLFWFLPSVCWEGVVNAVILAVRQLGWFESAVLLTETLVPGESIVRFPEALFVG
jgi:hypothetical protein